MRFARVPPVIVMCYGPLENTHIKSLPKWFTKLGLSAEAIKRRFLLINNQAAVFKKAGTQEKSD